MLQPDLLSDVDPATEEFGPTAVDRLLAWAVEASASDLHLVPSEAGWQLSARIEGKLRRVCLLASGGDRVIARLKVLARLLTYRSDSPQEGRLALPVSAAEPTQSREARLSTFPTVRGEKAVLRLFGNGADYSDLQHIGLPDQVLRTWGTYLNRPAGLVLISGPAGAGKTTTAYASLRAIAAASEEGHPDAFRSIVSLEDPVEQLIDGVAQTSVGSTTGLTFADGLRAVLRHDPEVIFVGELRDQDTVATAMRASLTGHLVVATIHAGSAAETVVRLFDANIEPFVILSGLSAVLHQRLVDTTESNDRCLVAELLTLEDHAVREAVSARVPTRDLEAAAVRAGMDPVRTQIDA